MCGPPAAAALLRCTSSEVKPLQSLKGVQSFLSSCFVAVLRPILTITDERAPGALPGPAGASAGSTPQDSPGRLPRLLEAGQHSPGVPLRSGRPPVLRLSPGNLRCRDPLVVDHESGLPRWGRMWAGCFVDAHETTLPDGSRLLPGIGIPGSFTARAP